MSLAEYLQLNDDEEAGKEKIDPPAALDEDKAKPAAAQPQERQPESTKAAEPVATVDAAEKASTPPAAVQAPAAPTVDIDKKIGEAISSERRQWRERDRAAQAKIAELEKSLADLVKANQPAPKVPSYEEDPAGFLRHQQEEIQNRWKELEQRTRQQEEHARTMQEQQRQMQAVSIAEHEFRGANPDYDKAFEHWRSAEVKRLALLPEQLIDNAFRELGYDPEGASKASKLSALQSYQERTEAIRLLNMGINPAQHFYNLSRHVYGYGTAGQPAAAPQEPAAPKDDPAVAKAALIQQGLAESGSLGGARQAAEADSENELAASLAAMKQFARNYFK